MWKKIKNLKNKMMEFGLIPMDKDFFMGEYGEFLTFEDLTRIRMSVKLDKKRIRFLFWAIYMLSCFLVFFGTNSNDLFLSSLEIVFLMLVTLLFICVFALYNNDVQIHCCEETIEILNKRENEIINKMKILKEKIK